VDATPVVTGGKRSLDAEPCEHNGGKGAEKVLPQTKLPARYARRIKELYGRCFVPRKKTPSLKVESVADARAREEKAAKKGGK